MTNEGNDHNSASDEFEEHIFSWYHEHESLRKEFIEGEEELKPEILMYHPFKNLEGALFLVEVENVRDLDSIEILWVDSVEGEVNVKLSGHSFLPENCRSEVRSICKMIFETTVHIISRDRM